MSAIAVVGAASASDDWVGLVIAVLLAVYLFVVLLGPERF
jgi:K+-transporting ATPase KdpF subunit